MEIKRISIVLAAFFLVCNARAQAPSLVWGVSFGSTGNEAPYDIVSSGNYIISTGSFAGTVDFDPGPGVASRTSVGNLDIYITCLDRDGNFLWANTIGSASGDAGKALYTDGTYVYATGYFFGTADFDPGPGIVNLTSAGGSDVYVCKYNVATGALVWAKNVGGISDDIGAAISANAGGIYIGGTFQLTCDFDPNAGVANLTSAGSVDAFVIKLDQSGNYLWANRVGNTGGETLAGLALDASGSVVFTGAFSGLVDFNPGPGTFNLTSNGASLDFYVVKLDASGNFAWAKNVGGTGSDNALDIALDQGTGYVYIGGFFQSTCDFDPGAGVDNHTSAGSNDIYVLTLDGNGNYVNAFTVGGTTSDIVRGIAIDQNNIYVTGGFTGTVDFDPGPGVQNLTGPGGYVLETDLAGNYIWAGMMGETATQFYSITADYQGSFYPTAPFQNAPDFDPGPGTYTLTSNGLNDAAILRLSGCPSVALSVASQTNVSCSGGSNGSATVSATGGTTFTYSWAPSGGNSATASGLAAGSYTCTVTNECTGSSTIAVTITEPTALTATSTQNNISCNGGSNGSATVVASGGTPSYTYSWAPSGGTAATASVLSANTYTCTIADANSCTVTVTFNITQPTAIVVTAASQTNISCNGGSNGAASINTPTGGAGGYTYNWTPGNPTGDGTVSVTGLTAGTWTCTVTDANSCVASQTFNITAPTALVMTAASQTNVSCNGGSNGAASVNAATGGAGGYTYNWTPGNPTGDGTVSVTGLTAGTWTCTVTDANSCTSTVTFNITAPGALSASSAGGSISCNGGTTTVTVTGTGGTSPYTGTGTFTVTAGTYTYTVTDANGCTATTTVSVTQPTALAASSSATSILCNGGTATVTVTGSGGTSPYTGDGTFTVTAGTYTYTVTDANGCTATTSVTVTEPTVLAAGSSATSILCNGGSATVTVNGSGGTSPYTGTGTFTVTAGTYTYTVTDANGCTATTTVSVTQPTALAASSSATSILCNGGTATVTVTGSGGTAPYTGDGTFTVTAGTYTYTVTDANGCTATTSITVTEPSAISTSVTQVNVSCNGGTDGSIDLTVSGGVSPYTFDWNSGAYTTEDLTGIPAGTYVGTLTDANGCTDGGTIIITEPVVIADGGVVTNATGCTSNDGSIDLTPTGGTAPFSFAWSNSATTEDLSGLDGGAYSVTITDANGCVHTASFTVTEPGAPTVTYSEPIDTACGGTIPTPAFTLSGESPAGGTWSGPGVSGNTFDASMANIGQNVITYTYTDAGGCTASATDSIWVDLCLGIAQDQGSLQFNVYPNPNDGEFVFFHQHGETAEVIICNALGQTVQRVRALPGVQYTTQIETSGVYTMILTTADGTLVSQRVVVNR